MARISAALRQKVTERAHGLCEYCQATQIIVVSLEVDHIIPESAGGATDLENLCLACRGCNGFKLDHQTGIHPETNQQLKLFNPRTQNWDGHFRWSDDGTRIVGLTDTGHATINRLQMNREEIIASRRLWVAAGWHLPKRGSFPLEL